MSIFTQLCVLVIRQGGQHEYKPRPFGITSWHPTTNKLHVVTEDMDFFFVLLTVRITEVTAIRFPYNLVFTQCIHIYNLVRQNARYTT